MCEWQSSNQGTIYNLNISETNFYSQKNIEYAIWKEKD